MLLAVVAAVPTPSLRFTGSGGVGGEASGAGGVLLMVDLRWRLFCSSAVGGEPHQHVALAG